MEDRGKWRCKIARKNADFEAARQLSQAGDKSPNIYNKKLRKAMMKYFTEKVDPNDIEGSIDKFLNSSSYRVLFSKAFGSDIDVRQYIKHTYDRFYRGISKDEP